ncbi:MAG: hypothetical protein K2L52_07065 [Clostridia bacterium]|nr:hypothetical protein [Clostridia bacterium]
MKENNQESNIIKVKQELDWYILIEYLESIRTFCPLFEDKKFSKMFQEMRAYAEDKIDVPYEIVDRYVTLEYKSN